MPAVVRKGDICSGHGPWPPRASSGGAGSVFVNGQAVHRQGDGWSIHCNPEGACHGGALAGGSSSVFAEGQAVGRVGDAVDCGSSAAAGSGDVFAGG